VLASLNCCKPARQCSGLVMVRLTNAQARHSWCRRAPGRFVVLVCRWYLSGWPFRNPHRKLFGGIGVGPKPDPLAGFQNKLFCLRYGALRRVGSSTLLLNSFTCSVHPAGRRSRKPFLFLSLSLSLSRARALTLHLRLLHLLGGVDIQRLDVKHRVLLRQPVGKLSAGQSHEPFHARKRHGKLVGWQKFSKVSVLVYSLDIFTRYNNKTKCIKKKDESLYSSSKACDIQFKKKHSEI
jgi:hypothetical protein